MAYEEPPLCRPSDEPWLGVRTLERSWKPPTPAELERSQRILQEMRDARANPFQPGDFVTLQSGGVKMTVTGLEGSEVQVAWAVDGEVQFQRFNRAALKPYTIEGSGP